MELACGNTSSACRRYFCPVVRSSIATPSTPSRLRSTSAIDASSFPHKTCCLFGACAKHVVTRKMTASMRLNVQIPPKHGIIAVLRLNLGFPQPFDCRLGGYRRVIDLFERIRLCLRRDNRKNFDVPMIILVNRLPIIQAVRLMKSVGRSVQDKMKFFCHGADSMQSSTQEGRQIAQVARAAEHETLKRSLMSARQEPGFIGHARSIGTQRHKVTPHLEHAHILIYFLGDDVAKYAAFFGGEVIPPGPQLIEHTAWDERCRSKLGIRMLELLARVRSIILEHADILEAGVAL